MDRDRLQPLVTALQDWATSGNIETGVGLDVVVDELLRDDSTEMAAAVGSVLERAALRIVRDGGDASQLGPLRERVAVALTVRVGRDTATSDRAFERSLGTRILDALRYRACSPSELAGLLDVDITQISRAGRVLSTSGELVIKVDPRDRRRRLYQRPTPGGSRHMFRDVVTSALNSLRVTDVASDLLPDRFGDRLTPSHFGAVVAAAGADLDSGLYQPTLMHQLAIPKTSGGERPAAALRYVDRLVYAALSERCRPEIEAALGPTDQVLWPRGETCEKRWVELESFVANIGTPYVLSVDIASFYDSIRHEVLADQLQRAGCDRGVVSALRSWLGAVTGRERGLPQGLSASDRLASIVLAPVDTALRDANLLFVRHGDDLRIAVATPQEAHDTKTLVRSALQPLDLLVNDDKTRWLRHETYTRHRTDVDRAVKKYLEAESIYGRDTAIYNVLDALGADEELMWDWYHSDLGVRDVLSEAGANLTPGDERALLVLLDAVLEEEKLRDRWDCTRSEGQSYTFLLQAGVGLLAASGAAEAAARLPSWLVERPEYTDVLSMYVQSVAPKDPTAIAVMLTRMENAHTSYDAQWLRLYSALGDEGQNGEFDALANNHLSDVGKDWVLRLRAGRFIAARGKPAAPVAEASINEAPSALRDDVLDLVRSAAPSRLPELLNGESETANALLAA